MLPVSNVRRTKITSWTFLATRILVVMRSCGQAMQATPVPRCCTGPNVLEKHSTAHHVPIWPNLLLAVHPLLKDFAAAQNKRRAAA